MAKRDNTPTAAPAADDAAVPAPMPTEGGSYVRQTDGTLTREAAPAEPATKERAA